MRTPSAIQLRELDLPAWQEVGTAIMEIERAVYEPGRRDTGEFFESIVTDVRAICSVALCETAVVGFCLAGPLERFSKVEGTKADENWGKGNTLYSADVTVHPDWRGQGIGKLLKRYQIERAQAIGYTFVVGRNRAGLADAMWRLNQSFGAVEVARFENSYPDGPEPRTAVYYRIDLSPNH